MRKSGGLNDRFCQDRSAVDHSTTVRKEADTYLLKHRLSDNAGSVKNFLSTLLYPLEEERHFALAENNCQCQPRLARNQFRSEFRSDPCISSVTTAIMITTSDSP